MRDSSQEMLSIGYGVEGMKRKSIKSLTQDVWRVFSEYIRKRDCLLATGSLEYGECFTCDFSGLISELQAGHFIPGRHNAYLFSERGVHAQCVKCNLWLGGNPHEYRRRMVELYGEDVTMKLEVEARENKKFTISELERLKKELKEKIKILEVKE